MIVLEIFALIFILFITLIASVLEPLFSNPYILYGGSILLFIWTVLTCRYECKMGDIKMKDNEISVEEVDFQISEFVF